MEAPRTSDALCSPFFADPFFALDRSSGDSPLATALRREQARRLKDFILGVADTGIVPAGQEETVRRLALEIVGYLRRWARRSSPTPDPHFGELSKDLRDAWEMGELVLPALQHVWESLRACPRWRVSFGNRGRMWVTDRDGGVAEVPIRQVEPFWFMRIFRQRVVALAKKRLADVLRGTRRVDALARSEVLPLDEALVAPEMGTDLEELLAMRELLARIEQVVTPAQLRAVRQRFRGETLSDADRDALRCLRRKLEALGISRASAF
ncbi:MAG: hypothetical protein AMS25_07620 [Gemmatimonas sp. SM23_52]|nr:MAG: hypothetical protein AMS25_07620 [Gemmatimonas sp. SM23_52]